MKDQGVHISVNFHRSPLIKIPSMMNIGHPVNPHMIVPKGVEKRYERYKNRDRIMILS